MKSFLSALHRFSSSWTGTIIIVLMLIFFVGQSFIIPSGSMKRTQLIGDFLFAKKFSYGIPIPHLPWLEIPLLPDFNDNGHLFEGSRPKREDIVIFRYPKNHKIHYVKRCVAVGGDELIYANKKLLIHFHEGDDFINKNYPKEKIIKLRDKLWVENPYMDKYPGIQYVPESNEIFKSLLQFYSHDQDIDMIPIVAKGLDAPMYNLNGKATNALYAKVEADHFYMIGDNRDNSNDSRFWGAVPYKLVVGKPWLIYMSLEHRSYDTVFKGLPYGGGMDHAGLRRICADAAIYSEECKALWEKQQYTIRWERIGRRIDSLQLEEPIE